MPTRLIMDTDIGTDVDDCLALALILASPELQLEAITCVYADVPLRVRMARKLLKLHGRDDVPVLAGVSRPLAGLAQIYWAGHEGEGLLEPGDENLLPADEHAVDYIVRTVMSNPGQIHLLGIGPLTNLAMAFLREPRLAENLGHLTIMGGSIRGSHNFGLPYVEHNIRCDPEAAHIVFTSGAPMTVVPLDVTLQTNIRRAGGERIRAGGTPFHEAVAVQLDRYPHYRDHGYTCMHDPLAVACVIMPDLIKVESLHIDVETGGRLTAGATLARTPTANAPANASVALEVDATRFEEFLVQRVEHDRF